MTTPPAFSPLDRSPVPLYAQVKERLLRASSTAAFRRTPGCRPRARWRHLRRQPHHRAPGAGRPAEGRPDLQGARQGHLRRAGQGLQDLARLEGFGEAMSRQGHEIVNRVVSHATQSPRRRSGAAPRPGRAGTPVTEIRRVRLLDGEPVSFDVTYLPPAIGERLRHEDLAERDIFLILENDYGIALGHADLQHRRRHCRRRAGRARWKWRPARPAAHRAPDPRRRAASRSTSNTCTSAATPSSTACACRATA